jgi:hypothetical protein
MARKRASKQTQEGGSATTRRCSFQPMQAPRKTAAFRSSKRLPQAPSRIQLAAAVTDVALSQPSQVPPAPTTIDKQHSQHRIPRKTTTSCVTPLSAVPTHNTTHSSAPLGPPPSLVEDDYVPGQGSTRLRRRRTRYQVNYSDGTLDDDDENLHCRLPFRSPSPLSGGYSVLSDTDSDKAEDERIERSMGVIRKKTAARGTEGGTKYHCDVCSVDITSTVRDSSRVLWDLTLMC